MTSKFERESLQNIKAEFLSGGQKRLVIPLSLLNNPKILLLDELFTLDIMTIKNLQQQLLIYRPK